MRLSVAWKDLIQSRGEGRFSTDRVDRPVLHEFPCKRGKAEGALTVAEGALTVLSMGSRRRCLPSSAARSASRVSGAGIVLVLSCSIHFSGRQRGLVDAAHTDDVTSPEPGSCRLASVLRNAAKGRSLCALQLNPEPLVQTKHLPDTQQALCETPPAPLLLILRRTRGKGPSSP